ncbi:hypothetical protein FRC19_001546 [Serendipita sp. 401]|nr:hypothetical protein FRC19_001546 [Serendipita sp. 401]KAG9055628.1 hypothetical protein FS842_001693 [Serendipita sp. 407]
MTRCSFCGKAFQSEKGLVSHLSQALVCKGMWRAWLRSIDNPSQAEDIPPAEEPISSEPPPPNDNNLPPIQPVDPIPLDNTMALPGLSHEPNRLSPGHDWPLPIAINGAFVATDDEESIRSVDSDSVISLEFETESASPQSSISDLDMEERSDDEELQQSRMSEPLESIDSLFRDRYNGAAEIKFNQDPLYLHILREQTSVGRGNIFHPFLNEEEFELGTWLNNSGLSQAKIDKFLKLKYVQSRAPVPSFTTGMALRKLIDKLPTFGLKWEQQGVKPHFGMPTELPTLFYCNPIRVIEQLLSRPALADNLTFQPEKQWSDEERVRRIYSDMNTGNWWWRQQDTLPPGATIIPVLIASDKTTLTDHGGDKYAWPVYISIGNIDMKARNTVNNNTWQLIAYIPIVKWKDSDHLHSTLTARFFHQCQEIVLDPLIRLGTNGKMMADSNRFVRHCVPVIAACIGDYPEQLLINIATYNSSPVSIAGFHELDSPIEQPLHTRDWILSQIVMVSTQVDPTDISAYTETAKAFGLSGVHKPFWENLPGYQPELTMSPDILHGAIRFWRDHIWLWTKRLVGVVEIDQRLSQLQHVVGLRSFPNGVRHISQMTGREDRELQRVSVALVAGSSKINRAVMRNLRAFHDFLYLIQYRSHDEETIGYIQKALAAFHRTKRAAWIDTGARRGKSGLINHFRIPKLSGLHVYARHIPELGSSIQFSTEIPERLHKPMAKTPYKGTNRKNYAIQMCKFLDRLERTQQFMEWAAWAARYAQDSVASKALVSVSPRSRDLIRNIFFPSRPLEKAKRRPWGTVEQIRLNIVPDMRNATLPTLSILYQLPYLRQHLSDFLRKTLKISDGESTNPLSAIERIDVWKNLRIRVPDVQDDEMFSQIHTAYALPPQQDPAYPLGYCHCVLVRTSPDAEYSRIQGHSVMQLRLIFRVFLSHQLNHPTKQLDLAYAYYFTSPHQSAEPDINMYRISKAVCLSGQRIGGIIPLDTISRFVQLIPVFGSKARKSVTQRTSSEVYRDFYVNSFATLQTYQAVY